MYNFNISRVKLSVSSRRNITTTNRDVYRLIGVYKQLMAELPQPVDRNSRLYKEYKVELQNLRTRSRILRKQNYVFDVYVKEYNYSGTVDYNYQHEPLGKKSRESFKTMINVVTDQAIKQARMVFKQVPHFQYFGAWKTQFLGKKKQGRVFLKEGEILRMYVDKNLKNLYTDKRPTEPKKYIGIELEFCAPINEKVFAVKLFRKGVHKFAQLKTDGSLRPQDNEVGYELALLLEESNYKKRLKQITDILTEVGAVAKDRRAGLHVHMDMRRRNKEIVYNNLVACQHALLSIVDPKRQDNEFCRTVNSRKFPTEFNGRREERYKTINAAAFYKYQTLEIRMHEGSIDYNQISSWIDLLIRISNYPKKLKNEVTKVSTLGKRFALNKKLYSYLQDRSCFWQLHNDNPNVAPQHDVRFNAVEALARVREAMNQPHTLEVPDRPEQPTWTAEHFAVRPRIEFTTTAVNDNMIVDEQTQDEE